MVREIKFTRRFPLIKGRGLKWLVMYNDVILFVGEIMLKGRINLLGGGGSV